MTTLKERRDRQLDCEILLADAILKLCEKFPDSAYEIVRICEIAKSVGKAEEMMNLLVRMEERFGEKK